MSTDYVERTTTLIRDVEGQELLPHAIRLLSDGEPVALERLAAASGLSVEAVQSALDEQASAERDDAGRLVGFALTLRPTSHRYTVGGRTLYAWCASDALMFPVILGEPGVVESTCPQTGHPIRIELTPDGVERLDPPGAVLSAVRPTGRLADVRAATCQFGHFFGSRAAATQWAEEHPDGHIHAVDEAFRLDREVIEQLGWDAAGEKHAYRRAGRDDTR
jgi:alkylmercury lyase